MPITKVQAEALATLACELRPRGAPRWDPAGVVAAIKRVNHLSHGEVTRAVVTAASDPDLQTPGAIGNPESRSWRIAQTPTPDPGPPSPDPSRLCTVCQHTEAECLRRAAVNGHEYLAEADHHPASPEVVRERVAGLKRMVHGFGRLPDDVAQAPAEEALEDDPMFAFFDQPEGAE